MPKKRSDTKHTKAERDKVVIWAAERRVRLMVLDGGARLRIPNLNFYPATGAINVDGYPAERITGAASFIKLIEGIWAAQSQAEALRIQEVLGPIIFGKPW